jgi:hypothetical protein
VDIEKKTEFPEERKGVITNLESIAWHCNNLLCPYCMEKHASLVNGLASEIADGKEGDQDTYRQLSDQYSIILDRLQKNKAAHQFTEEDVNFYRDTSRMWRRKLQGANADGHNHAEHIEHDNDEEENDEKVLYARCVSEGNSAKECKGLIHAHKVV